MRSEPATGVPSGFIRHDDRHGGARASRSRAIHVPACLHGDAQRVPLARLSAAGRRARPCAAPLPAGRREAAGAVGGCLGRGGWRRASARVRARAPGSGCGHCDRALGGRGRARAGGAFPAAGERDQLGAARRRWPPARSASWPLGRGGRPAGSAASRREARRGGGLAHARRRPPARAGAGGAPRGARARRRGAGSHGHGRLQAFEGDGAGGARARRRPRGGGGRAASSGAVRARGVAVSGGVAAFRGVSATGASGAGVGGRVGGSGPRGSGAPPAARRRGARRTPRSRSA